MVVQLGSIANFSRQLIDLDRETFPLRKLATCSFKRTSVERHFRQAGFVIDWCGFRLLAQDDRGETVVWTDQEEEVEAGGETQEVDEGLSGPAGGPSEGVTWHFPVREDLPLRSYTTATSCS